MKISFDIHPLLVPHKSGIGYYTAQIIQALIRLQPEDEFFLDFFALRGKQAKTDMLTDFLKQNKLDKNKNIRIRACGFFSKGIYKLIQSFLPLPYTLFFRERADVYYFFNYVVPPFVPGKVVLTVHDMGFKDYAETVRFKTRVSLALNLKSSVRRSDVIFTISQFSKERLAHYYDVSKKRVDVVYCGVDTAFYKRETDTAQIESVKRKYGIEKDYFLFIGTIEPRKNLERLIEAYALFAEEAADPPALVLGGGKGWLCEGIYEAANRVPAKGKVIFTGYLDEADIPALLSGALAFCFPSLYEGFGLPVLEAMACGTPVLTANSSSLPEVAGGAALMADKDSTAEIKEGLVRLYTDEQLRHDLAAKGYENIKRFNWDEAAKKMT